LQDLAARVFNLSRRHDISGGNFKYEGVEKDVIFRNF